jgi:hypothetical protein
LANWSAVGNASFVNGTAVFQETLSSNPTYPYYRFYRAKVGNIKSANAVGFVQILAPPGFSLIANQLSNGGNTPPEIFAATSVPEGARLQKYDAPGASFDMAQFIDAAWEGDAISFGPGDGGWFENPTGASIPIKFVGEVPEGELSIPLVAGWSLPSSMVPQTGLLSPNLGYVPQEGDQIHQHNPATGGFIINSYIDGAWEGGSNGSAPTIKVGESFWIYSTTARNWVRSFKIWP